MQLEGGSTLDVSSQDQAEELDLLEELLRPRCNALSLFYLIRSSISNPGNALQHVAEDM